MFESDFFLLNVLGSCVSGSALQMIDKMHVRKTMNILIISKVCYCERVSERHCCSHRYMSGCQSFPYSEYQLERFLKLKEKEMKVDFVKSKKRETVCYLIIPEVRHSAGKECRLCNDPFEVTI